MLDSIFERSNFEEEIEDVFLKFFTAFRCSANWRLVAKATVAIKTPSLFLMLIKHDAANNRKIKPIAEVDDNRKVLDSESTDNIRRLQATITVNHFAWARFEFRYQ